MLKELASGNYFIYQVKDGGFGIVKADTTEEAAEKVAESYTKHCCNETKYSKCDVNIYDIFWAPYDDTPDVIELGWRFENIQEEMII